MSIGIATGGMFNYRYPDVEVEVATGDGRQSWGSGGEDFIFPKIRVYDLFVESKRVPNITVTNRTMETNNANDRR